MPRQIFLNNLDYQFTGAVRAIPETGTPEVEVGYGVVQLPGIAASRLTALTGGDTYVLTAFKVEDGLETDLEIMKVTAMDDSIPSETRLTVLRGQEGTTIRAYAVGDFVSLRFTAGGAAEMLQRGQNLSELTNPATARTNLGLGTAAVANTGTGATNVVLGNDARLTDSRTPTGGAGGVLSGNYPNPGFAVDMATQAELDAVAGAKQNTLVSGTNIKTVNSTTLLGSGDVAVQPTLVSGTNIRTINSTTLLGSGDVAVQPTLVSGTNIKTINSTTLLGSGDVAVQPTLVSGTNIKTVGGQSLLGSGDVAVGTGDVTLTGTQTLTNKTIAFGSNTLTDVAGTTATQTLTNKTLNGAILNDGYTEEVFAVTGTTPALSPTNGSIQTWTLSGASTPTAGTWADGQSITLMVDDGSAFSITWTSVAPVWKTNGGSAPTLLTTGFTVIQLWKVGSTIYGARVGDA
jgi:hypothetical protein